MSNLKEESRWSSLALRILVNTASHPIEYAKVLIQVYTQSHQSPFLGYLRSIIICNLNYSVNNYTPYRRLVTSRYLLEQRRLFSANLLWRCRIYSSTVSSSSSLSVPARLKSPSLNFYSQVHQDCRRFVRLLSRAVSQALRQRREYYRLPKNRREHHLRQRTRQAN